MWTVTDAAAAPRIAARSGCAESSENNTPHAASSTAASPHTAHIRACSAGSAPPAIDAATTHKTANISGVLMAAKAALPAMISPAVTGSARWKS